MAINLLPSKSRLQLRQMHTLQTLNLIATALLIVFSLSAVAVFLFEFFLRQEVKKNQVKLADAKAQFSQFADKLDELQNLRFRAKLVAETIDKRVLATPLIEAFRQVANDAQLQEVEINQNKIKAKGKISGLSELEALEKRLADKQYDVLLLESLTTDPTGGISFALEIIPGQGVKK